MKYGSENPNLLSVSPLSSFIILARTNNRLFKKVLDARRAKFDELRRTLQYVEASRASATMQVSLFQQRAKDRHE